MFKYQTFFPGQKLRSAVVVLFLLSTMIFFSCDEFWEPDLGLVVDKEDYFRDWADFRSAEMGIYALQQKLVDQIIVLGELRGDLLEITPNAEKDLVEIYNFRISKTNKYASPENFYRLIGACNSLVGQIEKTYPQVLDMEEPATNADRLYGEVLSMRAWAYFNAVRIYGKVPYIWESLTSVNEITNYVNSSEVVIDTMHIEYAADGYYNDTIRNDTIYLDRRFLDMDAVIDTFTSELLSEVKEVGVLHNTYNLDPTWDITIWNKYAYRTLLGQMFLFQGDLTNAATQFEYIVYNYDSESNNIRFGLDSRFRMNNWKNIFTGIDNYEHIYTLWFGKSYQQQHDLQNLFSVQPPNTYQLKPTSVAIEKWESIWDGMKMELDKNDPSLTQLLEAGQPGDFYRGYGVSYAYIKNGEMTPASEVKEMLLLRKNGYQKEFEEWMEGRDTVVYKYTIGKSNFDRDANVHIYRAGGVHLYYAEIFSRWIFNHDGVPRSELNTGLAVLNDGSYNFNSSQLGVRGRVGFGDGDDAVRVANFIYVHDPVTNEIIDWHDYTGNLAAKQIYLEDQIIDERSRELAFEGERFYDLMRIAKRRNDPSYLANKVASKFKGFRAEQIRQILLDESNWYVPFYE